MAREFAKKFYDSKEWEKIRNLVFDEAHGICEKCGEPGEEVHHIIWLTPENINNPNISLGRDNLQLLCKDCHFNIHRSSRKKRVKRKRVTNNGMYFNELGELCQVKTYIVYGAPASGKSTYVKEHKSTGDLVVDLDLIMQAISMEYKSSECNNLLDIAIGIRDYMYSRIECKDVDSKSIWVVATLPNKKERELLKEQLKAELILIESTMEECIQRANLDEGRRDKELQKDIIDYWFSNYQA